MQIKLYMLVKYYLATCHMFLYSGSNSTVKFVMIDTVLLCGNTGYDDEFLAPKGIYF